MQILLLFEHFWIMQQIHLLLTISVWIFIMKMTSPFWAAPWWITVVEHALQHMQLYRTETCGSCAANSTVGKHCGSQQSKRQRTH